MPDLGYLENNSLHHIPGTFHELNTAHDEALKIAEAFTDIRPIYEIPNPELDVVFGLCLAHIANLPLSFGLGGVNLNES